MSGAGNADHRAVEVLEACLLMRAAISPPIPPVRARMLLQVHDELVFEAPPEEREPLSKLVKQEMEGVYKLDAPLLVDIGTGENSRDAK